MIHGIIHFDLYNIKAYSESVICDKVQIGVNYINKPNDRILLVSDDTQTFKYLKSLELHKDFSHGSGVIFTATSLKNDKYINQAFEVIKNKASKEEIPFNNGALEISIPHIDNWKYINSKDLVGAHK